MNREGGCLLWFCRITVLTQNQTAAARESASRSPSPGFVPSWTQGGHSGRPGLLTEEKGALPGRDDARPRTRLRPGRGCARGPGSLGSGSVRHPGQQAALGPPGKASRSPECGLKDTRRQGLKAGGPVQSVHGYFYLPGLAAVFTPPLPGPGSGQGVRAHAFPHVSSCCRSTALL